LEKCFTIEEVSMKLRLSAIMLLIFSTAPFAAGDHFPIAQGETWLFSYADRRGGWGSVDLDSGTVSWRMLAVATDGTAPGKVTTTVMIRRTISQSRKSFKPGRTTEAAYDSVFSPPRISLDTVFVTGGSQETGVAFKGDTCWSFVHDPNATPPAGKLMIRDTVVSYKGNATAASIIDQSPCRSRYSDRAFYITVRDVGPVEYHSSSSYLLVDESWQTDWKLIEAGVSTVAPDKPAAAAGPLHLSIRRKEVLFEGWVSRPGKLVASFYTVSGALMGTVETGISSTGFRRIEIPAASRRGIGPASGSCIIKLKTPDGTEITGRTMHH
jgi:hypothetical protein